jgi:hypothetical protein
VVACTFHASNEQQRKQAFKRKRFPENDRNDLDVEFASKIRLLLFREFVDGECINICLKLFSFPDLVNEKAWQTCSEPFSRSNCFTTAEKETNYQVQG